MGAIAKLNLDTVRGLSRPALRTLIQDLENDLRRFPQQELQLEHEFSKGLYGRKLTIPGSTIITGAIHKFQCMCAIMKGRCVVISQDGIQSLKAGDIFVSSPGAKRVIITYEETVWSTFHATNETDIEKLEKELVATSYDEVEELCLLR